MTRSRKRACLAQRDSVDEPARQGGGTAVLSGLLARDARWVAVAHEARGLQLNRTLVRDGWATLVLSR